MSDKLLYDLLCVAPGDSTFCSVKSVYSCFDLSLLITHELLLKAWRDRYDEIGLAILYELHTFPKGGGELALPSVDKVA